MATSTESISNVSITCAICLDTLSMPKALPCLHTFCLACLQCHIQTTIRNKGDKIACPACRAKCLPSNSKKPLAEWAIQFPTNFHIQNLIDSTRQDWGSRQDQKGTESQVARKLKEIREGVDTRLLQMGTEIQRLSVQRAHMAAEWQQSKEAVQETLSLLMAAVTDRGEQLVHKLDEAYVENTHRLYDEEEYATTKMQQLRKLSAIITDAMTGEGDNDRCKLDDLEQQFQDVEVDITRHVHSLESFQAFVIDSADVNRVVSNITDLGIFRAAPQGSLASSPTADLSASPPKLSSIKSLPLPVSRVGRVPLYLTQLSLRSKGDKNEPFVTGVCYCSGGMILLTDVKNRKLKGIRYPFLQSGSTRMNEVTLRSDPLCVTAAGSHQAVVGSDCCLYLMDVGGRRRMVIKEVIRTRHCYYGITTLADGQTVAACSDRPAGLDLIDLKTGHVLKTIVTDDAGQPLFVSPLYVTTILDGGLLVSDKDNAMHFLTCVRTDGTVIFKYKNQNEAATGSWRLQWPLGVSSTSQGSALVVDASLNAIFRLSKEGEILEAVVQDANRLNSPSALWYDEPGGKLFIVGHKGQQLVLYDFHDSVAL